MIGRSLWYLSLALIALVTAGLQLDKQSATWPEYVQLVPGPFQGFAQAWNAQNALGGEDKAAAVAEAELLVARRPVPAEHMTLLALAQYDAGLTEQSTQSIQLAGQRGWRELTAQDSVARLAIEIGDPAEAARRYTAMLVQDRTPDEMLEELGSIIFSATDQEARTTMAGIVAGTARWNSLFLNRGSRLMPPRAFGDVTVQAIQRGARFECRSLEQALKILEQREPGSGAVLASNAPASCPLDQ